MKATVKPSVNQRPKKMPTVAEARNAKCSDMGTNSVRVRVLLHRGRKRMAELLGKKEFQTEEAL